MTMYRMWKDVMVRKGYTMDFYAAVNLISQHTAAKYSNIIDSMFVEFSLFEYEGKKPFESFAFKSGQKAGILCALAALKAESIS